MSIEEKIKSELINQIYSDIDNIYDFIEQRYVLDDQHHSLVIKQLNQLKDQLYLVLSNSRLS